jgi:hypothetical protein
VKAAYPRCIWVLCAHSDVLVVDDHFNARLDASFGGFSTRLLHGPPFLGFAGKATPSVGGSWIAAGLS